MELTGIILFIGAIVLFSIWGRYYYFYFYKYKTIIAEKTEEEMLFEQMKGVAIFIAIAVSAGMAWG